MYELFGFKENTQFVWIRRINDSCNPRVYRQVEYSAPRSLYRTVIWLIYNCMHTESCWDSLDPVVDYDCFFFSLFVFCGSTWSVVCRLLPNVLNCLRTWHRAWISRTERPTSDTDLVPFLHKLSTADNSYSNSWQRWQWILSVTDVSGSLLLDVINICS